MIFDLSELANIHEGRRCFVIGSGPSLPIKRISELSNDIVITMNSSILATQWKQGRGDRFWVGVDLHVLDWSYFKEVLSSVCTRVVYCRYKPHISELPQDFYLFQPRASKVGEPFKDNDPGLCFLSAAPASIDLAILLGCSQIFLLGLDHRTDPTVNYFWENWPDGRPYFRNKIRKPHYNLSAQENVFRQNMLLYESLARYAKDKGSYIVNCTQGSTIKAFPFMSLKDVV